MKVYSTLMQASANATKVLQTENGQSRGTDAFVQEGAAAKLKTTEVEEAAVMTVVRKLTGGSTRPRMSRSTPRIPSRAVQGTGLDEDPFDKEKGGITDMINQSQVEASPEAYHRSCYVQEKLHKENMQGTCCHPRQVAPMWWWISP